MAQVPTYEQSVRSASLPGDRQQVSPPANAFGEDVGRAVERLGQTGEEAGYRAIQQIDNAKITDAQMKFMTAVDQQSGAIYALKGKDAEDAPGKIQSVLQSAKQVSVSDLNENQRRMFERQVFNYQRGVENSVSQHARQQVHQWSLDSAGAAIGLATSAAGMYADHPPQLAEYRKILEKNIALSNSLNGRSGDDANEATLQARTKFNMAVIGGYLQQSDPENAMKYAEENKSQIDPTIHASVMTQLRAQSMAVKAQKSAGEILDACDYNDGHGTVDWDQALKMARSGQYGEGATQDQVVKRINEYQAENKKRVQEDQSEGGTRMFQFLAQNNKTMYDLTPADVQQLNLPPSLVTTIAEMQSRNSEQVHKDPAALTDKAFALMDRIHKYDPTTDPDKSKKIAIDRDLMQLSIESSVAAKEPSKEWNYKINPDATISKDIHNFLYQKGPHGKPGGLIAKISEDVKAGAAGPWYANSMWSGPKPSPLEVTARIQSIMSQVKGAIHANPDWTPDDVAEYYDKNSEMRQMRDDSLRGHWKKTLTGSGRGPSSSFSPSDVLAKPTESLPSIQEVQ